MASTSTTTTLPLTTTTTNTNKPKTYKSHHHQTFEQLLDELESTLTLPTSTSSTSTHTPPTTTNWNLSHDAKLATTLHHLSLHIHLQSQTFVQSICQLEQTAASTSFRVRNASDRLKEFADRTSVAWRFDEDADKDAVEMDTDIHTDPNETKNLSDTNDKEEEEEEEEDAVERIRREEDEAISNGMLALSLCYDPTASPHEYASDHFFDMEDDDDDDEHANPSPDQDADDKKSTTTAHKSCAYYDSAPDDAFNRRPLPFVVGSREFMESLDAGIGDDYPDDDDDDEEEEEGGRVVEPQTEERVPTQTQTQTQTETEENYPTDNSTSPPHASVSFSSPMPVHDRSHVSTSIYETPGSFVGSDAVLTEEEEEEESN